jgi:putative DNA-invertase from lambdoid prophage Rac
MRVAIYCRVSTKDQDCDRQERELNSYCDRAGYEIVGAFKETASGKNSDRPCRKKVMRLARNRDIDAVLVSEMSRWGRSTCDLIETLMALNAWGVSLVASSGFQFDMATPTGKMFSVILAAIAEFERELICDRVCSGLAAAKARGVKLGRKQGYRPSDRYKHKVLALVAEGYSYRRIGDKLGLSPTTVMDIVRRNRLDAIAA